jgi:hypothetical protein
VEKGKELAFDSSNFQICIFQKLNFEQFERRRFVKRFEKNPSSKRKKNIQKEKSTHEKKTPETTMAAPPSQTPSILHLLDGYHFMT